MSATDPRAAQLDALARLVRDEVEGLARARQASRRATSDLDGFLRFAVVSLGRRLGGWCGIASGALVATYRGHGIEAVLAAGAFLGEPDDPRPHCWTMVRPAYAVPAHQWDAYATIVDITATQFDRLADLPVVRLDPGDPRRDLFALADVGDERALSEDREDAELIAAIVHRVEVRLGRREGSLLATLEAP